MAGAFRRRRRRRPFSVSLLLLSLLLLSSSSSSSLLFSSLLMRFSRAFQTASSESFLYFFKGPFKALKCIFYAVLSMHAFHFFSLSTRERERYF